MRVESSSLELYRVASEEGKANGKKIIILAGKAQPKIIREDKLNELITK